MIDGELVQYGALGLWTLFNIGLIGYFIKQGEKREDKLARVVENNTQALTTFNLRRGKQ